MKALNLPLLQVQYEILGEDLESLAKQHDCSVAFLEMAIKKRGWVRHPIAQTQDSALITVETSKLEEQIAAMEQRLNAAHVLRQGVLDPQYIQIEAAITAKTLEVINSIQAEDHSAAARLRIISKILASLRPTKAMIESQKNNAKSSEGIKLVIMNRVETVSGQPAQTEEVHIQFDDCQPVPSQPGGAT